MMIALSPGGACSDFYFKGKEHPRSLEAGSSGGFTTQTAVPWQGLGLSLGASLGGVAGRHPWPSPSRGREGGPGSSSEDEGAAIPSWEGFG